MHIDVWSDVICPWCYLGESRLLGAVDQLGWSDEITLRWRAYQLDPRATAEPAPLAPAIEAKYGAGAFEAMVTRLTSLGAAEGIEYRFDLAKRVNTVDAHRLLTWAAELDDPRRDRFDGPQMRLAHRLFVAYFTEGGNVGDHDTLLALVDDVGLDRVRAGDVLSSDTGFDEVADEIRAASDRNISGVPAFVIDDRLMIPGAQDTETLTLVLEQARERSATTEDGS